MMFAFSSLKILNYVHITGILRVENVIKILLSPAIWRKDVLLF